MEPGLSLPLSAVLCAVFICYLKIQPSSCVDADILEPPTNQTVPISQSEARFSCKARATAIFWLINDNLVTRSTAPNWINMYPDIHDFSIPTVTREIGVLAAGHNNTKIVCHATGSSQTTETSAPAWLVVAGVPLPPSPQLAVVNSSAISVTWNKPFSTLGFDILGYTVNIRNGTSASIIVTEVFNASGIDSYPVQFYVSPSTLRSECHNISVDVTASNSVGVSEPGVVVGRLPIVPRDFSDSLVVEVKFTTELLPVVNVTFKLPIICWFQTGNYSIQIVDSQTMQEALTPRQGTYTGGDNPTVLSVTFDTGFERDRYYEAVVTVETVAGSSNTSVHFIIATDQSMTTSQVTVTTTELSPDSTSTAGSTAVDTTNSCRHVSLESSLLIVTLMILHAFLMIY